MFSWFLISCSQTISLNLISAFQHNFQQSGSESEKGVFLQNRGAPFHLAVAAMSLGGGGAGDSGGGGDGGLTANLFFPCRVAEAKG